MAGLTSGARRAPRLPRLRDRKGQAAVEFALVLPLFLLLLVGMVEFARAWNIYQVMTDAARQGARLAVLADPAITEDSVRSMIANSLAVGALDPDEVTVTLLGIGGDPGTSTEVQLSYPYDFFFLGRLSDGETGGLIDLSTAVVMRHE